VLAEYLSFLILVPLAIVSWRVMGALLANRFPRVSAVVSGMV